MQSKNRFDDIIVFDDGPDIYARNGDGRVLFRYNKLDHRIAFFRSKRMTEDEKDFCLLMFDKYGLEKSEISKEELIQSLNYLRDGDLYCT